MIYKGWLSDWLIKPIMIQGGKLNGDDKLVNYKYFPTTLIILISIAIFLLKAKIAWS